MVLLVVVSMRTLVVLVGVVRPVVVVVDGVDHGRGRSVPRLDGRINVDGRH
jgi:hypothetical protein